MSLFRIIPPAVFRNIPLPRGLNSGVERFDGKPLGKGSQLVQSGNFGGDADRDRGGW